MRLVVHRNDALAFGERRDDHRRLEIAVHQAFEQIEQLHLKSSDHTKAHTLVAGETLSSVAYAAYGDPRAWRDIAEANAIEDPLAVPAGTILRIPRGDAS